MLGFGALVLAALILISPRGGTTFTAPPGATDSADGPQTLEAQADTNLAGPTELSSDRLLATAPAKEKAAEESVRENGDEQHEDRVAARIAALRDLSTKTDRASLETLLSEVKNQDEEIREAALDAITQSGNRAAIPGLREAAAQAGNRREKQAILDAIEFMSLPTLTEFLSERGATNNHQPPQARQ